MARFVCITDFFFFFSFFAFAQKLLPSLIPPPLSLSLVPQVDKKRLYYAALEPEGGASDVGLSIKHYAEANDVGVVVVGSRGMGAMKRALLSFVGLGSVSDWLASNMSHCPVIVVKGGGEKEQ